MKNFLVYNASAGSGKTYTLVKEYLSLALSEDVYKFKSVLAVTFTNKAAKEMKNRIMNELFSFFSSNEKDSMYIELRNILNISDKDLEARAEKLYYLLLHDYSDLAVCTIDTFVQKLARSFSKELSLPYHYSVILDEDDLVDDVLAHISDDIDESKTNFITDLLVDFIEYRLIDEEKGWRIENPVKDFIKTVLKENAYRKGQYHNHKLIDKQQFEKIKRNIDTEIKAIRDNVGTVLSELESWERNQGLEVSDYSYGEKGLPSVKKKIKNFNNDVLTERLTNMLNGSQKCLKNKIVLSNRVVERYNDAVRKYNESIKKYIVLSLIRKRLHLQVLRNYLYEYIDISITESNNVHLSEFNKRISEILGDCSVPFIYERLGEKYSHFFIDEFQDTSILQWHNFLPLFYNSLSSDNKNLLVGDAKQAIYRFRSGEVEQIINLPHIFKKPDTDFARDCEDKFIAEFCPENLNVNYRSAKTVVKFNNLFFGRFPDYADVDYIKKVYGNVRQDFKKNGGYVSVSQFHIDKNDKDEKTEYREFVNKSVVNRIIDLKDKGFSYKDIVILVRSKNIGVELAHSLAEARIPFVSSDSVLLTASDKVILIISALRYLVHSDDPVVRTSLKYYYDLAKGASDTFLNNNRNFDFAGLEELYGDAFTVYDLCVNIAGLFELNVLEDVFLQFFMNVVFEWQNTNSCGVNDFLDYWDKKNNSFTLVLPEDMDSVKIMTVHKAKGLEFKVVIYPYAFTSFPDAGITNEESWVDVKDYIPEMEDCLLPLNKEVLKNTEFERLYDEEYAKTILDDMNIMYVAMTRAEEMLFIYTHDYKDSNIFNKLFGCASENGFELSAGEDKLEFKVENGNGNKEYHSGEYKPLSTETIEKDNILTCNDDVKPLKWRDVLGFDEKEPCFLSYDEKDLDAREWGVLVHEIFSGVKIADDIDIVLRNYSDEGLLSESAAIMLKDRFRELMKCQEIAPAYSKDALIRNETDILTSKGEILRPDRYSEYEGNIILIDYKTGEEHKSYRTQLEGYKHALSEINSGKNINAYIVYINESVKIVQV